MSSAPLAYLILAHDQPAQLARLVQALDSPQARFHIHVDAKADQRAFESSLPASARVRYVRDRVKVQWMGYSIVEAALRMARDAMREGFSYALFLSGADYPIKPRAQIEQFYQQASEEYLCFWRLEDRPDWLPKVEYFYPVDQVPIRGWSTNTERSYWRRLFWGRWFKYRKYMPRRTFPAGLVPYGGPDWWSLSHECVAHVLEFVDSHPSVVHFFRYTQSPGELFFQTLVLNSRLAARVHRHADYEAWRRERATRGDELPRLAEESFNLRYIDWSGEITGAREAPAVLDERDWDALTASQCHFARKFDAVRSARLLDRIDAELLAPSGDRHAAAV